MQAASTVERRNQTLLLAAALVGVFALILQPRKLLFLIFLPLILLLVCLATLIFHLVLSYLAAKTSNSYGGATDRVRHDPVVPLLSLATAAGLEAMRVRKRWSNSADAFRQPLHPSSQAVSAALDELISVILDNHLLSWYTVSISPSDRSFPNAVERTIREVLLSIRGRLTEVDWAQLGVSTLVPKITHHLEMFQEAQQTLLESSATSASQQPGADPANKDRKKKQASGAQVASEELDLLLSNKYAELAGAAGLHPAVSGASFNSRPSEEKHLRKLIARILQLVMPERERRSSAVTVVTMEVVACAILRPVIEAVADPDLWNRMLDEKAGNAIRERKMVSKLRAALDANPSIAQAPATPKDGSIRRRSENISVKSSSKQFESFLRSLSRCPNLLEAKRLRNDIEINLRRARLPNAYGDESPEAVVKYIDRLVTAKQAIDRRIVDLGGGDKVSHTNGPTSSAVGLADILHHPGALSFFMEHVDRKTRSMLVQFYLTVEGLKDPLDEDDNLDEPAHNDADRGTFDSAQAQALREDVQLLLSSYLLPKAVPVHTAITETLAAFAKKQSGETGQTLHGTEYRSIRRTMFAAQAQVFEDMEEFDWPTFQKSDLYVKAVADMPTRTIQSSASPYSKRPSTSSRTQSEPELVFPSSASGSSKSSAQSLRLSQGRPLPLRRSGTALPAVDNKPAFVRSATTKAGEGSKNDLFGDAGRSKIDTSGNLDFLTGSGNGDIPQSRSREPLFQDEQNGQSSSMIDPIAEEPDDVQQQETMEAIQEALESILAQDSQKNSREGSIHSVGSTEHSTERKSSPVQAKLKPPLSRAKPSSLASSDRPSLHTRSASSRSHFDDDVALEPDERHYDSDELHTSARLAAPGNLELPLEILNISGRIDKLKNQETVLNALLRKAELTGNVDEVKILQKSVDALRREVSELSFQKRQFEAQADENKLLPGRTSVHVIGTTTGQSQGKEFALYLIEVHQLADDGVTQTTGWLVTRRFSEFVVLHGNLKEKVPAVKQLDLPNKHLVSFGQSHVQQRKVGLEKYLQSLIQLPGACSDPDLRAFLSQQNISLTSRASSLAAVASSAADFLPGQGLVRNLFRTVTAGMDDMFGGPSMLDTMILRLSQQAAEFAGTSSISAQNADLVPSTTNGSAVLDAPIDLLQLSAGLQPVDGEGLTYFTAPIANLLVEIFDLKDKGSWLRRQAIVIILQQVLGGTIERKVREAINISLAGDALLPHVTMLQNMMWPDGKMRPASVPRTAEEKLQTRESAYRKLAYLMPDVAASIIGRSNARHGARRIFSTLQNRRLNQHLIYTLLDDILTEIFGPSILLGDEVN